MHFKCVFIDDSVADSMKEWLKNEKKEYTNEAIILDIIQNKKSIEEDLHISYKALIHIRSGVNIIVII